MHLTTNEKDRRPGPAMILHSRPILAGALLWCCLIHRSFPASSDRPFILKGEPDRDHAVQASSDLTAWITIATNRASSDGRVLFSDPTTNHFHTRFYRAVPLKAENQTTAGFRGDRILVKPKGGVNLSVPNVLLGASVLRSFPDLGHLQVVRLPNGKPLAEALAELKQGGLVEYAEPDYTVQLLAAPNDFRFRDGTLWNFQNTGQSGGAPDADIDAPEAWDTRASASDVIVAIIDTGVRYSHEDLAANMWRNPGEISGNGVDDDHNGFIDDVHGINALKNDGDPNDDHGHGSHIAGTIGAVGNNEIGVVGVAWKVQIMACKFINPQGDGAISDAIACIDYARRQGAKIINTSWGAPSFNSQALREAIERARSAGIIVVAAAGNSAKDNEVPADAVYPASFDLDNILSVLATTRTDELAFFSNYGAGTVDIGAPGADIFSCWNSSDDSYQYFLGTSMAAAHVSGACALAASGFPSENYRQIINRVLSGADPIPSLAGKCVTGGRLNLRNALNSAPRQTTVSVVASDAKASETGPDAGAFAFTRTGDTASPLVVKYTIGGTASNGTDYQTLQNTVTIAAGEVSANLSVAPRDDSQPEANETVTITLVEDSAYAVGSSNNATVTIADDDQAPPPPPPPPQPTVTVVASDTSAAEAGPDIGEFRITRTGDTGSPLTVRYSIGGTAGNGADYQTLSGTATIAAGSSIANLAVRPIDDSQVESSETVVLTLASDNAYLVGSPNNATVTIADNDQPPPTPGTRPTVTVVASDPAAAESGDPGAFTISRSGGGTAMPLTVRYTMGEEARNGVDYQLLSGSVTIPAGATSATVTVVPIDDALVESDEPLMLMLFGYTGAPYLVGRPDGATVTIVDNDNIPARPTITVVASDATASESGDTAVFTVRRTGSTAAAVTVRYTMGEQAKNGVDYQLLSGSVTIPAGASSATVTVVPINDVIHESNEPVMLMLFGYTGAPYIVGKPDGATIMILDND